MKTRHYHTLLPQLRDVLIFVVRVNITVMLFTIKENMMMMMMMM